MGVKTVITSRTMQQALVSRCESLSPCLLPLDQRISPVSYVGGAIALSSRDYWAKMKPSVSYFMKTPLDLNEIRGLVRNLSSVSSDDLTVLGGKESTTISNQLASPTRHS